MITLTFPDTSLFRKAAIEFLSGNNPAAMLQMAPAITKTDLNIMPLSIADENNQPLCEADEDEAPIGSDVICPWTGERLDKDGGYPWNARIHGAKKAKLAKTGEWKLIKGIEIRSPGLVKEVRDEFDTRRNDARAKGPHTSNITPIKTGVPKPPASLFPAPETETQIYPQEQSENSASAIPVPGPAITAPPAPPTPPAALVDLPENPSFTDILSYATSRIAANDEYAGSVESVLERFKLTELQQVASLTPQVVKAFGQWLHYEWQMLRTV